MEMPATLRVKLSSGAPKDQEVHFYPATWRRWLGDLEGIQPISGEGKAFITRQAICDAVSEHGRARPADAFITVLQWGFGPGGRGASRARRMLTGGDHDPRHENGFDATVADRLAGSIDPILTGDPSTAYAYFRGSDTAIKGLGPAFFTKWIYAVSARGEWRSPQALPILDDLVQRWLQRETEGQVVLQYGSTGDYARYVALLDDWAQMEAGLVRVDIESAVFGLEREYRRAARSAKKVKAGA